MKKLIFFLCILAMTGCEDLIIKDISKKSIVVIAPTPDTATGKHDMSFVWEPLEGAENYRVMLVMPSFETVEYFVSDTTLSGHHYKITLVPGEYQWRIQAINSEYKTVPQTFSFRILSTEEIQHEK